MTVLLTYRGVVERDGRVRVRATVLPTGAEVVIVASQPPTLAEQEQRLVALDPEQWSRAFTEFEAVSATTEAEAVEPVTPEDWAALVKEARRA